MRIIDKLFEITIDTVIICCNTSVIVPRWVNVINTVRWKVHRWPISTIVTDLESHTTSRLAVSTALRKSHLPKKRKRRSLPTDGRLLAQISLCGFPNNQQIHSGTGELAGKLLAYLDTVFRFAVLLHSATATV